ncbi:hypothetical protein G9A89_010220 [Geosiphon pyriformis]|nr:hypothetical protein G9A89_010220 [Geosiphon pyriformis]
MAAAASLPAEIYDQIFQNFLPTHTHGPFSTQNLYSSVLVNSRWCAAAIPHLWSHPFSARHSIKQRSKIIDVYVSFLSRSEGRDIFSFPKKLTLMVRQICSTKTKPPLFDYPHFAQDLDLDGFFEIILCWCYLKCRPDRAWKLVIAMMKLFYTHKATFERVTGSLHLDNSREFLKIFIDTPGLSEWISSVRECRLVCEERMNGVENQPSLADLSCNLTCLEIDMSITNTQDPSANAEIITRTLKYTKGLKTIKIKGQPGNINSILHGLYTNASTLTEIQFIKTNFDFDGPLPHLKELPNLKRLTFIECQNLTVQLVEPLFLVNEQDEVDHEAPRVMLVGCHFDGERGKSDSGFVSWHDSLTNSWSVEKEQI